MRDEKLQRIVEQALEITDVAELVGETYDLEADGRRYWRGVDHDSLIVDTRAQRWYWNSQGLEGDAIDWLTKVLNYNFRAALDYLVGGIMPSFTPAPRPKPPEPRNMHLDAMMHHQCLMGHRARLLLLQKKRNLRLATILCTMLGWHPQFKGWTIPYWRGDTHCTGIKVRCLEGERRYVAVEGSRFGLYMPLPLPNLTPELLFIVEGEFKALSVMQLGAYAVGCPASGFRPDYAERILSKFGQAATIYAVRDNDLPGLAFFSDVRAAIPNALLLAPPPQHKAVDDWIAAEHVTLSRLIEDGAKSV